LSKIVFRQNDLNVASWAAPRLPPDNQKPRPLAPLRLEKSLRRQGGDLPITRSWAPVTKAATVRWRTIGPQGGPIY